MLINLDISKISIVEKSQSTLAMISTERDTPLEKDIAHVIAEVKKYPSCREQDVTYGSMIPVESLYRGDFDDYSALFICITNPTTKKGLHLQPEGRYLQGFCKGSWDKLPKKYDEMLKYAADHGLTLCGYSYEIGINEIVIDDMEDYITQIEIPIKPY